MSHRSTRDRDGASDDPPMSRLFIICNKANSEDDFRSAFEQFGEIEEIWVVRDKHSGENKGKPAGDLQHRIACVCCCCSFNSLECEVQLKTRSNFHSCFASAMTRHVLKWYTYTLLFWIVGTGRNVILKTLTAFLWFRCCLHKICKNFVGREGTGGNERKNDTELYSCYQGIGGILPKSRFQSFGKRTRQMRAIIRNRAKGNV